MKNEFFNKCIFQMFFYSDMMKMIHYSTDGETEHLICDEMMYSVIERTDKIAEVYYGIVGKPKHSDFKFNLDGVEMLSDLGKIAGKIHDILVTMFGMVDKEGDEYEGFKSALADYMATMSQFIYKCTFDKISTYKIK